MSFSECLRKSILQAAVSGKLTKTLNTDSKISDVISSIILDEDKYKGPVTEDVPFDIPESWIWVKSSDVIRFINGRAYKKSELLDNGKYPVLRVGNLFTNKSWYYSDLELEEDKYCENGDLLYSWSASFGPFIWKGEKSIFHYHIWKLNFSPLLNKDYIRCFLEADTEAIKSTAHGLAMVHVTKSGMEKRLIALPPIEEQQRIVDRVEELIAKVDELEKIEQELDQLESTFVKELRHTILFDAIQGKLTSHDSKEQINKSVVLESQSTLDPPIFSIPDNWMYCSLEQLGTFNTGKTPSLAEKSFWENGTINWFTSKDIKKKYLTDSQLKMNERGAENMKVFHPGTMLLVTRSGVLKHTLPVSILKSEATINQDVKAYTLNDPRMTEYIYFVLKALEPIILTNYSKKVTTVDSLKFKEFSKNMPIPLPPIEEQQRIANVLDELLVEIDDLEETGKRLGQLYSSI